MKYPVFWVDLLGSVCLALGGDVVFAAVSSLVFLFFILSAVFTTSCLTGGTDDVGMVVVSSSVALVEAVGA